MPSHILTKAYIRNEIKKIESVTKKLKNKPKDLADLKKTRVVLNDGGGLYLNLSTSNIGYGSWRLQFSYNKIRYSGKVGNFTLDGKPEIIESYSLEEARKKAVIVRKELIKGEHKRLIKPKYTLSYMLERYFSSKDIRPTTKNFYKSLVNHLINLGLEEYSIEEINLSILEKHIKHKDLNTSTRGAINVLNTLRNYGAKLNLFSACTSLDLGLIYKLPKMNNFKFLDFRKFTELIHFLNINKRNLDSSFLIAFISLSLTLCRFNEVSRLHQNDFYIDKENNNFSIVIPPERMKNKLEHVLPLDPKAFNFIQNTYEKIKALSYVSLNKIKNKVVEEFGEGFTFHGIRSTGVTTLNKLAHKYIDSKKVGDFNNIISMCISHAHKQSKVDSIYNRYQYFYEKKEVMIFWNQLLFRETEIEEIMTYILKNIG